MNNYYAHSVEGKPKSEWQGLEEYLRNAEGTVPDLRTELSVVPSLVIARHRVPKQSQPFGTGSESGLSPAKRNAFAAEFGSGDWAYLAGL